MSVRVFDKESFQKELRKAGFQPTQEKTEHFTIWKNSKGEVLSVNHRQEAYPYYYLNDLLEVHGIGYNFSGGRFDTKTYKVVKPKND